MPTSDAFHAPSIIRFYENLCDTILFSFAKLQNGFEFQKNIDKYFCFSELLIIYDHSGYSCVPSVVSGRAERTDIRVKKENFTDITSLTISVPSTNLAFNLWEFAFFRAKEAKKREKTMFFQKLIVTLHAKYVGSVKIEEVVRTLEHFAPLPLQENWDNAGLQLGLTEAEVSGVLLCLDVTEQVIDEAVSKGCNLVVSHHPLLFRGLKQITGQNDVQRAVMKAIRAGVCVVSMHTNLDNARGGVNFKIAERLGLQDVTFFARKTVDGLEAGSGVVGTLPHPMSSDLFVSFVKQQMEAEHAMCNQLMRKCISRVAICGGAGDFLLDEAVSLGADAFITGEMHYHQYFGYEQRIQICVIGHYESEHFTTEIFRDVIAEKFPGIRILTAETNTNPIIYL